jgi:signal transduction histidine kinase
MAKISRVVSSDIGTQVSQRRFSIPLRLKLIVVVFLALLPPVALWVGAQAFDFPVPTLVVAGAALAGLILGYLAGDVLFVDPIKALLAWTSGARDAKAGHVPIFPKLHADEIGTLGREISSLGAKVLQTEEEQKNFVDERSIFLMTVAHQLRTPITDLTWSIGELLDPATPEASREKLLHDLEKSLKRAQLVINHILASAYIEEGRFGYVMEMIDPVALVDKLIVQFKPLADDRSIVLRFEHMQLPPVYADAERISLALFDLLSNAIDYTPQGGRVTVALKTLGDRVEVSVADTGIGIPEKELPFLFTKFHRGENARHLRPNGSGLGLYLVKNIVSSHGSEIKVESDESIGGSRFSFSLPTKRPA